MSLKRPKDILTFTTERTRTKIIRRTKVFRLSVSFLGRIHKTRGATGTRLETSPARPGVELFTGGRKGGRGGCDE